MFNERLTENIVRSKFADALATGFVVEEQRSQNIRINKLLQNASKSANGIGKPEFIITSVQQPDLLIVIECKPDVRKHQSGTLDQYKDYAVDGALLYSSYLSKEFDVIAIGVSGQKEKELRTTCYLQLKSSLEPKEFSNQLLSLIDFQEKYVYNEGTKLQRYEDLLAYSRELNAQLHHKKIQEDKRSLLISGVLIALEYKVFRESFKKYDSAKDLAKAIVTAISSQLHRSNLAETKIETLEDAYSFIKSNKSLSEDRDFLIDLIDEIDKRINSFVKTYKYYDIFGEFYIEFLRYANNDKALGIVLTPKHITDLFTDLAFVNKDSVILDNCCGTGGFLISAMRKMLKDADHDSEIEKRIKESQIVGIEFQPTIYPLACSNMIIHGDGKTNLINDDCFKPGLVEDIRKKFKPNVGLLNPPYKANKNDMEELEFVLNCLDGLEKNGLCIALVPIQCAISQTGSRLELKRKILSKHRLEAVITLPPDIFHNSNAGVVTCAMVIRAHHPHDRGYETYFGSWKDDGFIKHKSRGRIDGGRWDSIREIWLSSYTNRKTILNLSVMHPVTFSDEWCAEAYMETDYSKLTRNDFINTLHKFAVYLFQYKRIGFASNEPVTNDSVEIDVRDWKFFDYSKANGIFTIEGGFYNKKPIDYTDGEIPFVGASAVNNGITSWHNLADLDKLFEPNCICVTNNGSTGCAYYWDTVFTCSHDINVLRLRNYTLDPYIAIFLCAVIEAEKFRWDYGRKWRPMRMIHSKIKLPIDDTGNPNWDFMRQYVKSLPYSKNLEKVTYPKKFDRGLSDAELVAKYESGGIDLGKALTPIIGKRQK